MCQLRVDRQATRQPLEFLLDSGQNPPAGGACGAEAERRDFPFVWRDVHHRRPFDIHCASRTPCTKRRITSQERSGIERRSNSTAKPRRGASWIRATTPGSRSSSG